MKIGFIGMGNMAQAIVTGWNATRQREAEEILAYAPHRKKLLDNAARLGFTAADSPRDLVAAADLVIMACKPYQVESVLAETADLLKEKPLLSVALGWDLAHYHSVLGDAQRVRYVMPSTIRDCGLLYPPDLFDRLKPMPFRGKQYPAVEDYDLALRLEYGDYMRLPPEEERVWKHHPILVDFHRNYEELSGERT